MLCQCDVCWVAKQIIATAVLSALVFVFACMIYHKNVSSLTKNDCCENKCGIILVLALCNWSVELRDRFTRKSTHSWILVYASSNRFCISRRRKSEKSGVCDGCWN